MLASQLMLWELYAIFDPDKICVDVFELLKVRGCALFFSYYRPGGFMNKFKNKRIG